MEYNDILQRYFQAQTTPAEEQQLAEALAEKHDLTAEERAAKAMLSYSAELSEKIQRGQTENALKCKTNGGTLPLGYYSDSEQNILIDPVTAAIPLEIFTRYDNGESIKEICDALNSRGLKTRNGKKFKVNGVSIILTNRKYMGEYKYRDILKPDGIPAIIDKDMFDRVQERMAKNKRAPAHKRSFPSR